MIVTPPQLSVSRLTVGYITLQSLNKIMFLDSVFVMTASGVQKIHLSCAMRL